MAFAGNKFTRIGPTDSPYTAAAAGTGVRVNGILIQADNTADGATKTTIQSEGQNWYDAIVFPDSQHDMKWAEPQFFNGLVFSAIPTGVNITVYFA
jgi:hypothetical protein